LAHTSPRAPPLPSSPTRRSSDLDQLHRKALTERAHVKLLRAHRLEEIAARLERGAVASRDDRQLSGGRALRAAAHRGVEHGDPRSEEHTSELQSLTNLVCRLLLE